MMKNTGYYRCSCRMTMMPVEEEEEAGEAGTGFGYLNDDVKGIATWIEEPHGGEQASHPYQIDSAEQRLNAWAAGSSGGDDRFGFCFF